MIKKGCGCLIFIILIVVAIFAFSIFSTPLTVELSDDYDTMTKKEYKSACQSIDYETLYRNVDAYVGEKVKFTGKIVQVVDQTNREYCEYRISTKKDNYGYYFEDVIYVNYNLGEDPKFMEDDIVKIYGEVKGEKRYESTGSGMITIPEINAAYMAIKK